MSIYSWLSKAVLRPSIEFTLSRYEYFFETPCADGHRIESSYG
jgi:hypothetical protein